MKRQDKDAFAGQDDLLGMGAGRQLVSNKNKGKQGTNKTNTER